METTQQNQLNFIQETDVETYEIIRKELKRQMVFSWSGSAWEQTCGQYGKKLTKTKKLLVLPFVLHVFQTSIYTFVPLRAIIGPNHYYSLIEQVFLFGRFVSESKTNVWFSRKNVLKVILQQICLFSPILKLAPPCPAVLLLQRE